MELNMCNDMDDTQNQRYNKIEKPKQIWIYIYNTFLYNITQ